MKLAKLLRILFFSSIITSAVATEPLFEIYLKAKASETSCKVIEKLIDEALERTAKKFRTTTDKLDLIRSNCLHISIEPLVTGIRPKELKDSPILEKLKKEYMQTCFMLLKNLNFKIKQVDISLGNWVGLIIEPVFKENTPKKHITEVQRIIGDKPHISLIRVTDKNSPNLEHKYAFGGSIGYLLALNYQLQQLKISFSEICLEIGNEQYGSVR